MLDDIALVQDQQIAAALVRLYSAVWNLPPGRTFPLGKRIRTKNPAAKSGPDCGGYRAPTWFPLGSKPGADKFDGSAIRIIVPSLDADFDRNFEEFSEGSRVCRRFHELSTPLARLDWQPQRFWVELQDHCENGFLAATDGIAGIDEMVAHLAVEGSSHFRYDI